MGDFRAGMGRAMKGGTSSKSTCKARLSEIMSRRTLHSAYSRYSAWSPKLLDDIDIPAFPWFLLMVGGLTGLTINRKVCHTPLPPTPHPAGVGVRGP